MRILNDITHFYHQKYGKLAKCVCGHEAIVQEDWLGPNHIYRVTCPCKISTQWVNTSMQDAGYIWNNYHYQISQETKE